MSFDSSSLSESSSTTYQPLGGTSSIFTRRSIVKSVDGPCLYTTSPSLPTRLRDWISSIRLTHCLRGIEIGIHAWYIVFELRYILFVDCQEGAIILESNLLSFNLPNGLPEYPTEYFAIFKSATDSPIFLRRTIVRSPSAKICPAVKAT